MIADVGPGLRRHRAAPEVCKRFEKEFGRVLMKSRANKLKAPLGALTCALLLLLVSVPAAAQSWKTVLGSHQYGPESMLAVDKDSQTFYMLLRQSPIRVARQFPCTTGQKAGDKLVRGDKRTPEGVYFIGGRINRSLDFDLYGDIAYSLNYPNPIDRIKDKTGSGIWLHGRGKTFVPRDTLGCVALKVDDMRAIETELPKGLPVVIAEKVSWTAEDGGEAKAAASMVDRVLQWAEAWESRDDLFFDYYFRDLFAKSERLSFDAFRNHKQSIFDSQPWIEVLVDNVHAMAGPDYWVTWFDQFYRTSSITSTVGKRLYWMQDDEGRWRIVGREYTAPASDVEARYLELKQKEVSGLVEQWADAWLASDAETYAAFYHPAAVQGGREGVQDIVSYKSDLWQRKPPVSVEVQELDVSLHPRGLVAEFVQKYADATGYSDRGVKTLILTPEKDGWKILSEHWREQP